MPLRAPCLPWDMTDQRETLEAAERYELACLPRGAAVKIMMNSHQEAEVKSLTQGKRQNLSETLRIHRNEESLGEANSAQDIVQVSPGFSAVWNVGRMANEQMKQKICHRG